MNTRTLAIASPCHEDWSKMTGDDRRRFCGSCNKHVTDLSAMTRRQAERAVRAEKNLCVRYTYKADTGAICFAPGRRERALAFTRRAAMAGLALLVAAPAFANADVAPPPTDDSLLTEIMARLQSLLGTGPETEPAGPGCGAPPPPPETVEGEEILMGDVAVQEVTTPLVVPTTTTEPTIVEMGKIAVPPEPPAQQQVVMGGVKAPPPPPPVMMGRPRR